MITAQEFLSESGKVAVREAIAAAEECTSAEIVCAVATESGRYDRAESMVGLGTGIILMSVVYALGLGMPPAESGSWGAGGAALGWLSAAMVAGFILGSVLASYCHALRRLFVGAAEMDEETAHAAAHVFGLARLGDTRARAGVLVYVSVFERRVVVMADTAAARVLGAEGIARLRDMAVERLREGRRTETFVDTIVESARALAGPLPRGGGDGGRVPDDLKFFHPRP